MSRIKFIAEHPEVVDKAGRLGFDMLYLVTEHVGLYERCGWRYLGDANETGDGTIRLYGARTAE